MLGWQPPLPPNVTISARSPSSVPTAMPVGVQLLLSVVAAAAAARAAPPRVSGHSITSHIEHRQHHLQSNLHHAVDSYLLCDFESTVFCYWDNRTSPAYPPLLITSATSKQTTTAFDFDLTTTLPPHRRFGEAISFYPLSDRPLPVVVPGSGGEATNPPVALMAEAWREAFAKRNNLASVRTPDSSKSRKYEKVSGD